MQKLNFFKDTLKKDCQQDQNVNQKYKDNFFTKLYKDPKAICDLYSKELHKGEEITEDEVELITLDNPFVNAFYNDLGFIVKDRLIVLVEQQSSVSGNMPIRFLIYLAEEYKKYIKWHELNLFTSTINSLPKPELYLIYTGNDYYDKSKLVFGEKGDCIYVDLTSHFITNASSCDSTLEEYLYIVKYVEQFPKKQRKERLIEALNNYKNRVKNKNPILENYLKSQEVDEMYEDIFGLDNLLKAKEQEGIEKGIEEILLTLYLSGTLNRETVLKELNITNSEFDKLFEDYKQLV